MYHELPVPPQIETARKALELVRVWAADGHQYITIATDIWEDPAAWGLMLADLAKHIAVVYEKDAKISRGQIMSRIREGFDAEWNNPTE